MPADAQITEPADPDDLRCVGQPLPGVEILLLDPTTLEGVADGRLGEIFIAGAQVGLGYLSRPALTAERFILRSGQTTYRTGDLAIRDACGRLLFCGRADDQVKLRGQRVELAEVDAENLPDDPSEA